MARPNPGGCVRARLQHLLAQLEWAIEAYRLKRMALSLVALVLLWLVASVVLWWAEQASHPQPGEPFYSLIDCFWTSTVYLLSGLEEYEPATNLGKMTASTVMIAGVGVLGFLGTTLLAAIVESVRLADLVKAKPSLARLRGHIVICGWNPRGDAIIREMRGERGAGRGSPRQVVIVTPDAREIRISDRRLYSGVWGISGDPTQSAALLQADIDKAHSVVVLAQAADDARGRRAADARTLLTSLAVQSLCPDAHTLAELLDYQSRSHFKRQSVSELIYVRRMAARLLGHTAMSHYLTDFYVSLMSNAGNVDQTAIIDLPDTLVGSSFRQLQRRFAASDCPVVPIGVWRGAVEEEPGPATSDGLRFSFPLAINPRTQTPEAGTGWRRLRRDDPLARGDRLVVITRGPPDLKSLPPSQEQQGKNVG